MDLDWFGWGVVLFRAIPLIVMTVVASRAANIRDTDPTSRRRRILMVRLVWGATFVVFAGGLATVGVLDQRIARTLYTAWDTVVLIVAVAVLSTYGGRR